MSQEVEQWFEEEIGLEARITTLGHIQRGGNPTVYDRLIASEFVIFSLNRLLQTSNNHHAIVYKGGTFDFLDIETITKGKYTIKSELLQMGYLLAC